MRQHFYRVKDSVLVAVQRRDAGRAKHGIFSIKKRKNLSYFSTVPLLTKFLFSAIIKNVTKSVFVA